MGTSGEFFFLPMNEKLDMKSFSKDVKALVLVHSSKL